MMNRETPLLEIVTSSQDINNRLGEPSFEGQESQDSPSPGQGEEDEWQDGDGDPCPLCNKHYKSHLSNTTQSARCVVFRQGTFWIYCDYCKRWFCGECVNLDAKTAERYLKWKCPLCRSTKLDRQYTCVEQK